MQTKIPCVLMRGGTSKGPFFLVSDLLKDADWRDRVLLKLMGSPDIRQIDGIEEYLASIKPAAGAPASHGKPGSSLCWLAADEGAGDVAEEDSGFFRLAMFKAASAVSVPLGWFSGETGDKIQQGELVLARPRPSFLDKLLFPKKRRALVRCRGEDASSWT